jgi:hypothetical protein
MTHVTQMESREKRAMRPLLNFFSHNANFKQFLDVVVFKTRHLPLRVLDWFVTNYLKKNDVCYEIKRPNGTSEIFCVYRSYRAQLKGHKKKEFDPCCRGDTIVLEYESPSDGEKIAFETAICQLKFFKWAIENLILNYVETHFEIITSDLDQNSYKSRKMTGNGNGNDNGNGNGNDNGNDNVNGNSNDNGVKRRKKTELSQSIYQHMHVSKRPTTFNFNKSHLITHV